MNKKVYLKGLNGIRAIAALAVVFAHTNHASADFGLPFQLLNTIKSGQPAPYKLAIYGVTMFFSLSGFLISYLLCKERETVKIDIKKFYIRRALRIWPLYYTYLLVAIVTLLCFKIPFDAYTSIYYVFFAANIPYILGTSYYLLIHFWSLGVEEQFYLIWPWFFKIKIEKLQFLTAALISIIIIIKCSIYITNPSSMLITVIDVIRVHCMMIGGLGAMLFYQKKVLFLKLITNKLVQLTCWIVMLLVAVNEYHIASIVDNEILAVVTCIIVIGQATGKGLINLENRFFDFLGRISYGIYVIHPLVIFFLSKLLFKITTNDIVNFILIYSAVYLVTILISYLSYNYFESIFLKIKRKKFTVVQSSASMFDFTKR